MVKALSAQVDSLLDASVSACQTAPMNNSGTQPKTVEDAATLLRAGRICAFPTETVYGLGADASNVDAVLEIYEAKARPRFNPLIVHCANMAMVEKLVHLSPLAKKVATLWPGPLSLVLPLRDGADIADIVTAGLDTLAVRIPAHQVAHELIMAVGKPLAAPSANPSGKLSATNAETVGTSFKGKVPVLDGGACEAGLESTIIGFDGDELVQLRAGALPREDIEAVSGQSVRVAADMGAIISPGMLASHYAPNAKLRLNVDKPKPDEVYLAFGPPADFSGPQLNLSATSDLREAARNLFAYLHQLDTNGRTIAVAPVPKEGLGEAINDRLQRAAAPRD